MALEAIHQYWGKAKPAGDGPLFHPLTYHSLDVAASGAALLELRPSLERQLCAILGSPDLDALRLLLQYLFSIHDLGKFARTFQNFRPDLAPPLPESRSLKHSAYRHDALGFALWRKWSKEGEPGQRILAYGAYWIPILISLVRPFVSHHGAPADDELRRPPMIVVEDAFEPEDEAAANAFEDAMWRLFRMPDVLASLGQAQPTTQRHADSAYFWLNGIAILADWVGSNQTYFPYQVATATPLGEYYELALRRARTAVRQFGLVEPPRAAARNFREVFPAIRRPTGLQRLASRFVSADGPQLIIIEELTGSGKTEAALAIAQRLIASGGAEGLYYALPTMATADGMYSRIRDGVYSLFFASEARPSLMLAHSAAHLNALFLDSIGRVSAGYNEELHGAVPGDLHPANLTATAQCARWLTEHGKRSLLADVGVGTIDQALLGALLTRHNSLRLLGLARKVLIVDEVHSYDPYVLALLGCLLKNLAQSGGSVILLSATLPVKIREKLESEFASGAGWPRPLAELKPWRRRRYPLLSVSSVTGVRRCVFPSRADLKRSVQVENIYTLRDVHAVLRQATDANRCICWLRNTVADAREAFDQLPDDLRAKATLFHSRFAVGDRLEIQNDVLRRYGPGSGPEDRAGRILIATQVVEQSLDLDFDDFITDLAPIDLIIQRLGRLRRHLRDLFGARKYPGPDERGPILLYVFGPEFTLTPEANWYSRSLPRASRIYSAPELLWRTAALLQSGSTLELPTRLRDYMESVFGNHDAHTSVPAAFLRATHADRAVSQSAAHRAQRNSICDEGGPQSSQLYDSGSAFTRLGQKEIVLRLCRWNGKELRPWREKDRDPWSSSEIRCPQYYVGEDFAPLPNDAAIRTACEKLAREFPDRGREKPLLPLVERETGIWEAVAGCGPLAYDVIRGLRVLSP